MAYNVSRLGEIPLCTMFKIRTKGYGGILQKPCYKLYLKFLTMDRLIELLDKRKKLTANIFEEEELMDIAKKLPKEESDKIEPELLTYSNSDRLSNIMIKLDELSKKLGV